MKSSSGEVAVVRGRLEADLFSYAASAAGLGRAWMRHALLAIFELTILGVLIAFLIANPSRVAFIVGWAAALWVLHRDSLGAARVCAA